MRRRRARRDGVGAYALVLLTVVGTAAIATFVLGRAHRTVHSTDEPFHRHLVTNSFDPISDVLRGLGPRATTTDPGAPRRDVRAIVVGRDAIALLSGGKERRRIPTASSRLTLAGLVTAIGDRRWLARRGDVVTAKAAVVVRRGATLTAAAPRTRTLVLESRPGVFLGARTGTLRLDGLTVRPSRVSRARNVAADGTRPFVLAQRDSRMVIRDSVFRDLGHDWNSSYGVTWASGSSGAITGSQLTNCYIGIYTDSAHDLLIRGNRLAGNTLYGIDPHSGSRRIVVERNTAEGSGRHGIIFSQAVSASVVRGNVARGNHLNGIMMDAGSVGNLIVDNLVEDNRGDGIVLAGSPGNRITRNRVVGNRIGVFARDLRGETKLTENVIADNARAAQGIRLDRSNDVHGNGGQWLPGRIRVIWLAAAAVTLFLWALTLAARRSRDRRLPSRALARG